MSCLVRVRHCCIDLAPTISESNTRVAGVSPKPYFQHRNYVLSRSPQLFYHYRRIFFPAELFNFFAFRAIFATFLKIRNLSQPFRNLFATFGPKIDHFLKDLTKIKTPRIWKKKLNLNKKKIASNNHFTMRHRTETTIGVRYFTISLDNTCSPVERHTPNDIWEVRTLPFRIANALSYTLYLKLFRHQISSLFAIPMLVEPFLPSPLLFHLVRRKAHLALT